MRHSRLSTAWPTFLAFSLCFRFPGYESEDGIILGYDEDEMNWKHVEQGLVRRKHDIALSCCCVVCLVTAVLPFSRVNHPRPMNLLLNCFSHHLSQLPLLTLLRSYWPFCCYWNMIKLLPPTAFPPTLPSMSTQTTHLHICSNVTFLMRPTLTTHLKMTTPSFPQHLTLHSLLGYPVHRLLVSLPLERKGKVFVCFVQVSRTWHLVGTQ